MPVSKTKTECEKYIPGFNQETLAYISVLIIISHASHSILSLPCWFVHIYAMNSCGLEVAQYSN